jgi:hypothetical protein
MPRTHRTEDPTCARPTAVDAEAPGSDRGGRSPGAVDQVRRVPALGLSGNQATAPLPVLLDELALPTRFPVVSGPR